MAGLETDASGVRAPGGPGHAPSEAGITTKLRDSCQSCAMSKVKCPREKPTCSRCEHRGLACKYIFTRRPGRKRDHSRRLSNAGVSSIKSSPSIDTEYGWPVQKDTIEALQPSAGAYFASRSTTPHAGGNKYLDISPQSFSIPATPQPDHAFATETSDVYSVLGDANMFSAMVDFGPDGNDVDFIMSTMDSPFGIPVVDSGTMTEGYNDIGSLLIPPQGISIDIPPSSAVPSSVGPTGAGSMVPEFAPDMQVLASGISEVTRATDMSPCGCLTKSLELLNTLSARPAPQAGPSNPSSQETSTAPTYYGSPHSILTENKQSIEAVSERLACPYCPGDNFLLAVLSMTVLKILERYAAAARAQPDGVKASGQDTGKAPRLTGGKNKVVVTGRAHGTPRRAAQLVLSELHRVQRLVNQLSPRLRGAGDGAIRGVPGPELELWGRQRAVGGYDGGSATPFSAATLGQMESDVRRSLGRLSSEIISGLRQS